MKDTCEQNANRQRACKNNPPVLGSRGSIPLRSLFPNCRVPLCACKPTALSAALPEAVRGSFLAIVMNNQQGIIHGNFSFMGLSHPR